MGVAASTHDLEDDMDFDLSEDQTLLQDSVRRLLADRYGFEQRKAYMASEQGWSREVWAQYAELGPSRRRRAASAAGRRRS